MDWLDPRPGEQHFLDVGRAAGGTAAEPAARCRPGGAVTGVDLAESMVSAARGARFPDDRIDCDSSRPTSRRSASCRGHRSTRRSR